MVSFILLIIGGLNWGLAGIGMFAGSNWNVVNLVVGSWPSLEALVYVLVGLAAVWEVVMHKKQCRMCGMGGGMSSGM
jgi:uncharacterized membrane protein YuzA (DUF378 family)